MSAFTAYNVLAQLNLSEKQTEELVDMLSKAKKQKKRTAHQDNKDWFGGYQRKLAIKEKALRE